MDYGQQILDATLSLEAIPQTDSIAPGRGRRVLLDGVAGLQCKQSIGEDIAGERTHESLGQTAFWVPRAARRVTLVTGMSPLVTGHFACRACHRYDTLSVTAGFAGFRHGFSACIDVTVLSPYEVSHSPRHP